MDKYRPKLSRAEYVEMHAIRGVTRNKAEVVFDEIRIYLSLDEFSMYCNDDIGKYYLRKHSDIIKIIENICVHIPHHPFNGVGYSNSY